MIPLSKLQKLPRHQRLRKAWKIFAAAERRLVQGGGLENDEAEYCRGILQMLAADGEFSPAAGDAIKTALEKFEGKTDLRRVLNSIRHLLLSETGRSPADWDMLDPGGMLDPAQRQIFPGVAVYLDDIRSPFNVGAMFRTAESFGVEKVYLSPLCAAPDHPRAKRTAMGCAGVLPYERSESPPSGGPVFALETGGLPLDTFPFPRQGTIIAGSEELGVSPRLLEAADASLGRVSIPCYGAKGSLNVSVAFGIVMQAWAAKLGSNHCA